MGYVLARKRKMSVDLLIVEKCIRCNNHIQQTRLVGLKKRYCSEYCYNLDIFDDKYIPQKKIIFIPDSETAKAYLAGLIDCDGYISINKTIATGKTRQKTDCYYSLIGVTNTSIVPLQWITENFGGWYGPVGGINAIKKKIEQGHKPEYVWQTTGKDAGRVIQAIYPYLTLKQPRADILLKLEATKSGVAFKHGSLTPESVLLERKQLKEQMNILNKRGLK